MSLERLERDAWFVGYVPDLLTAAWVGFDDGAPLRMSSGEAVIPMWADYMSRTHHSSGELSPPNGVTMAQVDAVSGQVWQQGCGPEITEAYLSGTKPRDMCGAGGGGFQGDLVAGYEEPAIITDQQAMDMSAPPMGNEGIVNDPAESEPISPDDTIEINEPDTFGIQLQQENQRQLERQRQIDERQQRERARVFQTTPPPQDQPLTNPTERARPIQPPPQSQPAPQPPPPSQPVQPLPRTPVDSQATPKKDTIPRVDSLTTGLRHLY